MRRRKSRELVLITGAHGFLGQHVVRLFLDETSCDLVLAARDEQLLFTDSDPRILNYHKLDVTDRVAVRDCIRSVQPDVIVNCAAFVDVDRAETEREKAWRTNVSAVEYLVEAARKVDARIAHVSSDYVFDGVKPPFAETSLPNPLNYYGRTKLASENVLRSSGVHYVIIRMALLYGVEERSRKNFALRVLDSLRSGHEFRAFTDLIAPPLLVDDAAFAVVRTVELQKSGLYHLAGPEAVSRFDFAHRIAKAFHLDASLITPALYDEYESKANRPRKSIFVTLKAQTELLIKPTGIDEGLQVMLRGLNDIAASERNIVYS